MSDVHWLLDLDVDGHIYQLSELDLDILKDDGSSLHYTGALEVQPVTESISLLDASATQPEAQVRIWLDGVSTQAILRSRGELSRWVEGSTHERRRRVLVGACQSPEMLSPEEGITTTLAQDAWLDPQMLIRSSQTVSTRTWATASTLVDGTSEQAYPIVIGHPGRTSSGWCSALVTLCVDRTLSAVLAPDWVGVAYVLAGHHVSATTVRLCTETDLSGITARVINTYDDLNQPVAVCPWFWASSADPVVLSYDGGAVYTFGSGTGEYGVGSQLIAPAYNDDSNQPAIYAAFKDDDDPTTGGLQADGGLLRGAGSVLGWALSQSGARVDRARMVEAINALDTYQIDTVIAEAVSPWGWISNVLLPILPCSMAAGPDGLYIVPLLLDQSRESDAEARLDTTRPDVAVVGGLKWDTSKLIRSVTLRYNYDVRSNGYRSRVVYGSTAAATADSTGTTDVHPTLTLAAGWGLTGEDLTLDTAAIYNDETAALVAYTVARVRGLPTGTVAFDVPEDDPEFFALRLGSIVYCYDASLGLDRVGQVLSIDTPGGGSLIVTVWFCIDPSRDVLS